MGTRAAKRKELLNYNSYQVLEDKDRISDLPLEIVHHIFSFLPFKYVARTSVLSKRWTYLSYSYPCLEFTNSQTYRSYSSEIRAYHAVRWFNKHSDDVRILKFCGATTVYDLETLIREAVKHNVEELDLQFYSASIDVDDLDHEWPTVDILDLPSCIVNSLTLRDLTLMASAGYGIRLPPLKVMKNGFKTLGSLLLSRVNLEFQPLLEDLFTDPTFSSLTKLHLIDCVGFEFLRIQMVGLRDLSLERCFELQGLDIYAEKLKKLSLVWCFDGWYASNRVKIEASSLEFITLHHHVTEEFVIGKLDSLKEAVAGLFVVGEGDLTDSKMHSVSNFLTGISQCQVLTLGRWFLEILSRNNGLGGVQLPAFDRVKSLKLETDLIMHDNPALANLFRISLSTVHTIVISASSFYCLKYKKWNTDLWESTGSGEEEFWDSQAQSLGSFLCHLKFVKIVGWFRDSTNLTSLVKFFLKHGKVLQQLSLSKLGDSILEETIIKSKIMRFSGASSNAQIIFEEAIFSFFH